MDLVWAYQKLGDHCDIEKSLVERYYFIASLVSFQTLFPDATSRLYCDTYVRDLIYAWEVEDLIKDIVVVDFKKELYGKYNVQFYAYPKLYAMLCQTEPFWILDTDRVVLTSGSYLQFLINFNKTKYYGEKYCYTTVSPLNTKVSCRYPKCFKNLLESYTGINGGIIYYPDSTIAQIVSLSILSLVQNIETTDGSNICVSESSKNFLLFEEVPILRILESLGKDVLDLKNLDFLKHPSNYLNFEKFFKALKYYYSKSIKILGVEKPEDIILNTKAFKDVNIKDLNTKEFLCI